MVALLCISTMALMLLADSILLSRNAKGGR